MLSLLVPEELAAVEEEAPFKDAKAVDAITELAVKVKASLPLLDRR